MISKRLQTKWNPGTWAVSQRGNGFECPVNHDSYIRGKTHFVITEWKYIYVKTSTSPTMKDKTRKGLQKIQIVTKTQLSKLESPGFYSRAAQGNEDSGRGPTRTQLSKLESPGFYSWAAQGNEDSGRGPTCIDYLCTTSSRSSPRLRNA